MMMMMMMGLGLGHSSSNLHTRKATFPHCGAAIRQEGASVGPHHNDCERKIGSGISLSSSLGDRQEEY